MMKKNLNKISGVTLIELLVGIAVTALMMGAMFASYTAVNSSYKQVTDKARISSSSRDIVGMMMKDIRLAGFKYYYGQNTEDITFDDNLTHISGLEDSRGIIDTHDPLIVFRDTLDICLQIQNQVRNQLHHEKIDLLILAVTAYILFMGISIKMIQYKNIRDTNYHILHCQ